MKNIFEKYNRLMYEIAFRVLKNHHDAEDVVVDSLCKIKRNIDKIIDREDIQVQHFVMIVTERTAIDLYRKKQRSKVVYIEEYYEKKSEDYFSESWQKKNLISEAIASLPPNYREVILLRYGEGYTVREIARILGCSVAKVEKTISRGKNKLRDLLEEAKSDGREYLG